MAGSKEPRASRSEAQKTSVAESKASRAMTAALQAYDEALSKHGGSLCDRYILMAVHDEGVQKAIVKHIAAVELFVGAYCPTGPGIPEEARVVFEFRCLPPRICLFPNLFLVVLNAFTGRVLRIIDPYFAGMEHAPAAAVELEAGGEARAAPTTAAHHPSVAAHHPTLAAHHPTLAAHHPSLAAHHPSLAAHHPSLAAHHPTLAAHHPGLAAHHPSLAAHHPSLAAHHPTLAAHHPSLAAHHPSLAAHHPTLGI